MHSIAHRSVTIVTILTLIFTPLVLRGGHVIQVLTGHKVEQQQVQCKPGDPCPLVKVEVHKIVQDK
jgi:hypothetical protein